MLGRRVDREVAGGDRSECRREPVHVVEQVERVRHADQPDEQDRGRDDLVRHEMDMLLVRREHDRSRAELGAELRERREGEQVVGQASREEQRTAAHDAPELGRAPDGVHGDRERDPAEQPGEDSDAPERRRHGGVPALPRRSGDDASCEPRAERYPDHRRRGGKSGSCREHVHEAGWYGSAVNSL